MKHIEKGDYGYARKNKNIKLALTLGLFMCILVDVVLALIIYQTRNTLLTILACVMSLPFAKMLISYIMCIKFTPLKKDEYAEIDKLAKDKKVKFLYDISISKEEGIKFYPCVLVLNNNIIAYVPDAQTNDKNHEYTEYLKKVCENTKYKYRTLVVSDKVRFEKEINKISLPDEEDRKVDRYIKERILTLGV